MSARRLFVLMTHEPAAGAAVRPVGVLGLDDGECRISWLPYEPGAELWRERVTATEVPLARAVRRWLATADGISSDIVEVTPPETDDLITAVEATVDLLLAAHPSDEAS
jgi:hypothetical protein